MSHCTVEMSWEGSGGKRKPHGGEITNEEEISPLCRLKNAEKDSLRAYCRETHTSIDPEHDGSATQRSRRRRRKDVKIQAVLIFFGCRFIEYGLCKGLPYRRVWSRTMVRSTSHEMTESYRILCIEFWARLCKNFPAALLWLPTAAVSTLKALWIWALEKGFKYNSHSNCCIQAGFKVVALTG